ncbi:hypothetical protein [Caulobacter segnis]
MSEDAGPVAAWVERVKKKPVIAAFLLGIAILGGTASALGDLEKLAEPIKKVVAKANPAAANAPKPIIEAFSLSPNATGYEETQEGLFADASRGPFRTFQPRYPWDQPAVPIFLLTISNPSDKDMIITGLTYRVDEIGQVMGGPAGPVQPLARYQHKLAWVIGDQKNALVPPFNIPAKSSAALEVQLSSNLDTPGLGWLMKIGVQTNGGTDYTKPFQLYLPKFGTGQQGSGSETNKNDSTKGADPTATGALDYKMSVLPRKSVDEIICLMGQAGLGEAAGKLDVLDRDKMMWRAASDSLDEFLVKRTYTDPPMPYSSLMTREQAERYLRVIKTHVACGA